MAFFDISYSDDSVTFVNTKTQKAEKLELFTAYDDAEAIRIVNGEIKARDNVSKAAVSLLSHLLDNPRLDEYKGLTPINVLVPNDLKSAIRDLETEYLKPRFSAPLEAKGNTPATIEKQWQLFAAGLREGGGYANAKSRVIKYFAHMGSLPIAANGKCITVAAIDKILANELQKVAPTVNEGIAGKLVKLSSEIGNRKETTDLGDYATAIAALKSMLATYEGLYREALEDMTSLIGNTSLTQSADAVMQKASIVDTIEGLQAQYDNGQITEDELISRADAIGYKLADEIEAPI